MVEEHGKEKIGVWIQSACIAGACIYILGWKRECHV